MKRKLIRLSQRYVAALQKHLRQGPRAIPPCRTALALGRQAAALDLETLDVARIHEGALATLEASRSQRWGHQAGGDFFCRGHHPDRGNASRRAQGQRPLEQLNQTLGRRTVDLAASNRSLKQGIVQRKTVEQALKKSGEHSRKLLKESRRLQKHLQRLTHQILSAQEDKRKKISRDLHDEIAQTLLGINVRLLTLKKEAAINAERPQERDCQHATAGG